MGKPRKPESLPDRLRRTINGSGLSFHELGRRAHVDAAQLSRFMAGNDLTLVVATRLCEVLGLELVQSHSIRDEPLEEPAPTTRRRRRFGLPLVGTIPRGQGRRVDLKGLKALKGVGTRARGGRKKTGALLGS